MYTLTKYAIGDLEERFQILLTEDEVSFLTIHFQLAFEKIKITNHILIVCQSGFATSELILTVSNRRSLLIPYWRSFL